MKRQIIASLGLAGSLLASAALHAQTTAGGKKETSKEETVVIKRNGDPKTVIEIKNGSIYVNGDPVVTIHDADAAKVHKKIIIENSNDGSSSGSSTERFEFPSFGDMGMNSDATPPANRKAMLGVLTDPKDKKGGALVKEVTPSSPADKAGIKTGDRILRLDGKTIADASMLSVEVGAQHNAGDKVTIEYERDGRTNSVSATLTAAPKQEGVARDYHFNSPQEFGGNFGSGNMPNSFFREFSFPGGMGANIEDAHPKVGVSVEDRADGSGVTVLGVTPSSSAAKAGIREGDIITKVGDDKIESAAALQDLIGRNKPGERLSLKYQRNGKDAVADIILPRPVSKRDL